MTGLAYEGAGCLRAWRFGGHGFHSRMFTFSTLSASIFRDRGVRRPPFVSEMLGLVLVELGLPKSGSDSVTNFQNGRP